MDGRRSPAHRLLSRAWEVLQQVGEAQAERQADTDPAKRFLELLASALGSGLAHVANTEGNPPQNWRSWGWQKMDRPNGDQVGWVEGDDLYLIPHAAYRVAKKMAGSDHQGLTITLPTLQKQLEQQHLLVTDDRDSSRNTRTIRKILQGRRHQVLHIRCSSLFPDTDQSDQCDQPTA